MDTNQIKKFAIEARNKLKEGVAMKMASLGFTKNGEVAENMYPALIQGGSLWKGQIQTETFFHQWMSLYTRIQDKGMNEVYEEAAYTWFNRLVAIRILQKNGLAEPILDFADVARTPLIVDSARSGRIPTMREEQHSYLMELLDNDTKTTEQFAVLITAWCRQNPIIKNCFGSIADYTELLLPNNILAEGGFMDMLNHTVFISDNDYQSPELIGWLYQFYISERKDEVFAKKGKYTADEIPAATQIFTPNWIVKYMVQNTVGRIYLDNNPSATAFKEDWKYLVEGEATPEENIYRYSELTDLKVADLACGSGHIMNECFDILFDLYIAEGYTRSEAIENIFRYNLTGIDLDKRAQQLATFALLLKASQRERAYVDAHCLPNVLTMPKLVSDEVRKSAVSEFLRDCDTPKMKRELDVAFELMKDSNSLGSIMKFDISEGTRFALIQAMTYWDTASSVPDGVQKIIPAIKLILALTEKYSAVVMNPPYMKAANMNEVLYNHIIQNYKEGASDMYSVFMMLAMQSIKKNGYISMIVQPTWLVNFSFGDLRGCLLANFNIDSLLHMGRGNFGNDWGSIAFSLSSKKADVISQFYKLYERTFYRIDPRHISDLFIKAKQDKIFRYKFADYDSRTFDIGDGLSGQKIFYECEQSKFNKIINAPFCYTFSDDIISIINETSVASNFNPATGLQTGNNSKYIRVWMEVSIKDKDIKWFPLVNGGDFRKWYGNLNEFIYWFNDGEDIKNCKSSVLRNQQYYKLPGISWNRIASRGITLRYFPSGCFFDQAGDSMFSENLDELHVCMAYLNSKVAKTFFDMLAPTINLTAGMIGKLPYKKIVNHKNIQIICGQNISISKLDWDSHESSWDFRSNELVSFDREQYMDIMSEYADLNNLLIDIAPPHLSSLESRYELYKTKWETNFRRLHANEEELNRQFIEIYGLQDELTPDVPLSEITILQQGEVKIVDGALQFQADVVIKQLISYAIGCWMGRYRLDKPGLYIAHPDVKEEEIVTYPYRDETLTIDDDGIIPILPYECPFEDNLQNRIADFVRIAFGNDSLAENLNFVEQALGCTIEKYLDKEYWKDHKKMYQNRPIYWLWSSKKGTFKVISYMHRMDAYTAERVRSKYLLPYIEYLNNKIADLESRAAQLSVGESRKLDALRKAHTECVKYHERLQVVAEQAIAFDLDDGVVVNYAKFGDVLAKLK